MFLGAQGKIRRTWRYCEYSQYMLLAVHIPEILPVLQVFELSPAKVICSNPYSWNHLWVICAERWAWELSTRCTDLRGIHRTPSITEHIEYFGTTASTRSTEHYWYQRTEHLKKYTWYLQYPHQYRTSRYVKHSYCEKARSTYRIVSNIFSPKYWEQLWKVGVMYARHAWARPNSAVFLA